MKLKKTLKRNNIIILIFSLCLIISCKSKPNDLPSENCSVIYEDKRPKLVNGYDPSNGMPIEEIKQWVSKKDSISVNFLSTFTDDTVYIYKNEELITLAILKTDMRLACAKGIKLCKSTFNNAFLIIKINNKIMCPIKIDNEYLSIDVYYDKKQKKAHVFFNNNILILS